MAGVRMGRARGRGRSYVSDGTVFSVGLGAGLVCAGEWFDAEVGVVHLHAVECAGESVCDLNSVDAGNVTVRLLNGAVESGLRCGVHVELVVGVAGDGPSLVVGDTVVVDVFVRESGEGVHVAALCSAVVSASVTCAATVGACSVGEYLSGVCGGAPTPSCVACTNKPGNSTYTSRGGTSSDCGWVCNVEHYQSGITCPACSVTCPGGQYISAACGVSRDIVCTACGSEEYESEVCAMRARTACSGSQVIRTPCSSTSNAECAACGSRAYESGGGCDACTAACPRGQIIGSVCGSTHDSVCVSCGSSEFESGGACYACTEACTGGQIIGTGWYFDG